MCVNRLIQNYRRTPEKLHAVQMKPPHFSELLMVHFIETLYYFTKLPHLLSCNAMLTNCNSPHKRHHTEILEFFSFPFHTTPIHSSLHEFTNITIRNQFLYASTSDATEIRYPTPATTPFTSMQ